MTTSVAADLADIRRGLEAVRRVAPPIVADLMVTLDRVVGAVEVKAQGCPTCGGQP